MANAMKVTWVLRTVSHVTRSCRSAVHWRKHTVKGTLLLGGFFGKSKTKDEEKDNIPKLEEPDPSKLSREYLIKSASINTAEEAGTLVLQTGLALIQAEKEYSEAVFALVLLMEYKLKVLDSASEQERIWDLILQARELVNRTKTKKRTLEMILINSKNMLSTAAEVAFMTGAEFAGSLAGDRLYKIELHLKQVQEDSENVEIKLRQIEAKTIEVESDHASKTSEQSSKIPEQVSQLNLNNNEVDGEDTVPSDNCTDTSSKTEDMEGISSVKQGFSDGGDSKDIRGSDDFRGSKTDGSSKSDLDNKVNKGDTTDAVIADTSHPEENEHENLKF